MEELPPWWDPVILELMLAVIEHAHEGRLGEVGYLSQRARRPAAVDDLYAVSAAFAQERAVPSVAQESAVGRARKDGRAMRTLRIGGRCN